MMRDIRQPMPQPDVIVEKRDFENSVMLIAAQWLLLNQEKVQNRWTGSAQTGV